MVINCLSFLRQQRSVNSQALVSLVWPMTRDRCDGHFSCEACEIVKPL
jgi:hypothetical protein